MSNTNKAPAVIDLRAFVDVSCRRRCSVCEKPLLGEQADATGRCETCTARNAYTVTCGCGFLYADETCEHVAPEWLNTLRAAGAL